MIVIGDTSGLIAAFNPSSSVHSRARQAFIGAPATVISPLVMLEIEHIMTREHGREAAYAVNDWPLGNTESQRIIVPAVDDALLRRARRVQDAYRDLRLDLTDAVNVALADAYDTARILTLDARDFRAVTPLTAHSAFVLLPEDGES